MIQPTTAKFPYMCRAYWMMIGPMFLLLLAVAIVRTGNGWFTPPDFGFLAVLGGLVLARWFEFRAGNPQTSTGEPATTADLRRYVPATIIVGLVVWVIANLVGNYWLAH